MPPKHESRLRYDWAIKRLLRDSANYSIINGFLSALLERPVAIQEVLEGESNLDSPTDKLTRVDILVKEADGSLCIIEIQNDPSIYFIKRMVFAVAQRITQSITKGTSYEEVKHVEIIYLLYHPFAGGKGYIYDYKGEFIDRHSGVPLVLTEAENKNNKVDKIMPGYHIVALDNYVDTLEKSVDYWLYLLKYEELPEGKAPIDPVLLYAKQQVDTLFLNPIERKEHDRYLDDIRQLHDKTYTRYAEGIEKGEKIGMEKGLKKGRKEGLTKGRKEGEKIGIEKGKAEGLQEGELKGKLLAAKAMLEMGFDIATIMAKLRLSEADISGIE